MPRVAFALLVASLFALLCGRVAHGSEPGRSVLDAERFRHYVEAFNRDDELPRTQSVDNDHAWEFLRREVPLFECPDPAIEEAYYFRWWTYRKHLKQTPDGFVVTEFLPPVPWAGKFNTISCAAGHHFYEGRWLRDPKFLDDYARFWFHGRGNPRGYSCWLADALWARACVTGSTALPISLLPDLVRNYEAWEQQPPRRQRPVLAERRSRWHGSFHRRQRLPRDDQQLHVRRCTGDRPAGGRGQSAHVGQDLPHQGAST